MSFMKFMFGMGKQKTQEMGDSVKSAIVSWDPLAASEVQIEEMQKRFEALSVKVETARQDWQKEQKEYDVIQENYEKKKKAAQILQGDMADANEATKKKLENALTALVDELEELKPDVEQEKLEAVEAKQWLQTLESDLTMFADKLKTARKNLTKAVKSMEKAEHREERAVARAQEAAERAGIRTQTDAIDDVLNIMNKNVDKANAKADAADKRSKLLTPTSATDNSLVADALARANGTAEKKSVGDRLANL